MAYKFKDKLLKTRGLTFWKVVLAIAFGFGSSVYIFRPAAIELRQTKEKMDQEDTKNYTI